MTVLLSNMAYSRQKLWLSTGCGSSPVVTAVLTFSTATETRASQHRDSEKQEQHVLVTLLLLSLIHNSEHKLNFLCLQLMLKACHYNISTYRYQTDTKIWEQALDKSEKKYDEFKQYQQSRNQGLEITDARNLFVFCIMYILLGVCPGSTYRY